MAISSRILALVAKALGKKYDIQISVGSYQTASTNGTSIYVPLVDGEHAVSLARGYIDHEAAHIRLTDFSILPTNDFKGQLLNILEDIRIEKAIGKDYPGCAVNLRQLSAVLEEKYGVFKPNPNNPSSTVLAWISAQGRVDTLAHDSMLESAKAAEPTARMIFGKHFSEAQRLLGTIPKLSGDTSGTAAVRDLRDQFMTLLGKAKEDLESQQPPQAPTPIEPAQEPEQDDKFDPETENKEDKKEDASSKQGGDSTESKDEGGEQDGSGSEEGEGDTAGSGSGEGETDEEGEAGGEGKSNGGSGGEGDSDAEAETGCPEASEDGNGAGAGTGPGTPEEVSAVMEALEEALGGDQVEFGDMGELLKELLKNAAQDAVGNLDGIPKVPQIIKHPSHALPFEDLVMVKSHTAKLRAQVAGLIQATKLQRSLPSRNGRKLDNRVLSRLRVGDDRLFSRRDEKKGVNTAILHVLDGSGSMFDQTPGEKMFVATRACYVALEALYPVPGVTSAAMEFNSMTNAVYGLSAWGEKPDSTKFNHVSSGGTELSTALWAAWSELIGRPETRKIAVVYSDGDTNYSDENPTHAAIKRMKEDGIEVIGIGIQDTGLLKYLPEETEIINNLSQLTPALLRLLKDKLLEAA